MKFLVTAALLTTALALPSALRHAERARCDGSTDPSTSAVENAINTWIDDVKSVNFFLDNTPAIGTFALVQRAQQALNSANDEPNELNVLASICELNSSPNSQYQNAVATLEQIFSNVPTSLQNIIKNSGNGGLVAADIQEINAVRCCSVLPSLDILFLQAAEDYGLVGVTGTSAPRPNACSRFNCE